MSRSWIVVLSLYAGAASAALAQNPVPGPTGLSQYQSDGTTPIAEGGEVNQSATLVLKGNCPTDPTKTPTTVYRLEVEVRPTTAAFSNAVTHTPSVWVTGNGQSTVVVNGLQPGQTYHWQVRNRTS